MPDRPSIRRLGPADYAVMPWRNGLGTTIELAISPPGASLAGPFDWRLSVATLLGSGPFSRLPGVERHIVQLEGAPMRVTHPDRPGRELTLLAPYLFQGDWDTHAEVAGPARDFNVMTARNRVRATVNACQLRANSIVNSIVSGDQALCVSTGEIDVTVQNSEPQSLSGHETLVIAASDDQPIEISMTARTNASVFWVSFTRKS